MFHLTSWPEGPFSYVLHNRDFQVFHAPRGRATRRAMPRRAAPRRSASYTLLYPDSFLSLSLSLFPSLSNEPSSSFLAALSSLLFPFFLSFLSLFPCFVFSSLLSTDNPPKCVRQLGLPRGRNNYPRREKKRNINFQDFRPDRRALAIKFQAFQILFFIFICPIYHVPC